MAGSKGGISQEKKEKLKNIRKKKNSVREESGDKKMPKKKPKPKNS